jgi:hypothetical protein
MRKDIIAIHHLDIGFILTKFHEFWCLSISKLQNNKRDPQVRFT